MRISIVHTYEGQRYQSPFMEGTVPKIFLKIILNYSNIPIHSLITIAIILKKIPDQHTNLCVLKYEPLQDNGLIKIKSQHNSCVKTNQREKSFHYNQIVNGQVFESLFILPLV